MALHRSNSFQAFSQHVDAPYPSRLALTSSSLPSTSEDPSSGASGSRVYRQNTMPLPTTAGPSRCTPAAPVRMASESEAAPFAGKRRTKSLSGKSVRSMRSIGSLRSLGSFGGKVRLGRSVSGAGRYAAYEGDADDLTVFEDAKPRKKSISKPPSSFPPTLTRSASTVNPEAVHPRFQRHNKSVPNLRIALGKSGSISHTLAGSSSSFSGSSSLASLSTSSSSTSLSQGGTLDTPISSGAVSIRTTRSMRSTRSTRTTATAHTGFSALTSGSTIRAKVPGNPSHPFIDYVPGPLFAKAPRVYLGSKYADKALPHLPTSEDEEDDAYSFDSDDEDAAPTRRPSRTTNAQGKLQPPVPRVPTMYASPATLARRATEREALERKSSKSAFSTGTKRRSRLQVRFRNSQHRASHASMIAQEWKKRQSAMMLAGVGSPSLLREATMEEEQGQGQGQNQGAEGYDQRSGGREDEMETVYSPPAGLAPATRSTTVEMTPSSRTSRPPSLPPKLHFTDAHPARSRQTALPSLLPPVLSTPATKISAPMPRLKVSLTGPSAPSSSHTRSAGTSASSPYQLDIPIPSSRISRVSRYMGDWEWYSDQLKMEAAAAVTSMPDLSAVEIKRAADVLMRGSRMPLPSKGGVSGSVGNGVEAVGSAREKRVERFQGGVMGRTGMASSSTMEAVSEGRPTTVVTVAATASVSHRAPSASPSSRPLQPSKHFAAAEASESRARPAQLTLTSSNYKSTAFSSAALSRSATMSSMASLASETSTNTIGSTASTSSGASASIASAVSAASLSTADSEASFDSITSDILSSYASSPSTGKCSAYSRSCSSATPTHTPTPMTASTSYALTRPQHDVRGQLPSRLPIATRQYESPIRTRPTHSLARAQPEGVHTLPLSHENLAKATLERQAGPTAKKRRGSGTSELSDLVDLVHLASLASAEDLAPFMRNLSVYESAQPGQPQRSRTIDSSVHTGLSGPASRLMNDGPSGKHVAAPSGYVQTGVVQQIRIPTHSNTISGSVPSAPSMISASSLVSPPVSASSRLSGSDAGEKRSRGRLNRSSSIVGGTVVSPARRQLRTQAHMLGVHAEGSRGMLQIQAVSEV